MQKYTNTIPIIMPLNIVNVAIQRLGSEDTREIEEK
jgi:hypothetical protein